MTVARTESCPIIHFFVGYLLHDLSCLWNPLLQISHKGPSKPTAHKDTKPPMHDFSLGHFCG